MSIIRTIHHFKEIVHLRTICTIVLLAVVFFSFPVSGRTDSDAAVNSPGKERTLVVGVTPIAPFAMKNKDGQWHGITWAIWHLSAQRLGWTYEIKEMPLERIIPALLAGEIDIAATANGITASREEEVDFTIPYLISSFGIATVKVRQFDAWMDILKNIMSVGFLKIALTLLAVLILISYLFWILERRRVPKEKRVGIIKGVGNSILLTAETMTTVGYGENVPVTALGRLVAIIWMFIAITMLASLTAGVASSLTTLQLHKNKYELADLQRLKVGCLALPSRSALYLKEHHIKHEPFDTVPAAFQALVEHKIDAVVYDFSTLQYLVENKYKDELSVTSEMFHPQFFGLPLAPDSPLRRPLNLAMVEVMKKPLWRQVLISYLGRDITPSMGTGSID